MEKTQRFKMNEFSFKLMTYGIGHLDMDAIPVALEFGIRLPSSMPYERNLAQKSQLQGALGLDMTSYLREGQMEMLLRDWINWKRRPARTEA